MKFDFSIFIKQPKKAFELFVKLDQEVFLKSEIDVVYSDYINWERCGILLTSTDKNKGTQNKLTFKQYLWSKLVEQLRKYNFSYNEILKLKNTFIEENHFDEVIKLITNNTQVSNKIKQGSEYTEEQLQQFKDLSEDDFHLDQFVILIITAILSNESIHLDFFKEEGEVKYLPNTKSVQSVLNRNDLDRHNEVYQGHFLSISLSKLLQVLFDGEHYLGGELRSNILSKDEHQLLYQIRRNFKSVKEIRIKFKKGEVNLLEVDCYKKVELESKILDLYRSKDYKNIELVIEKGVVRAYIETTKIKL